MLKLLNDNFWGFFWLAIIVTVISSIVYLVDSSANRKAELQKTAYKNGLEQCSVQHAYTSQGGSLQVSNSIILTKSCSEAAKEASQNVENIKQKYNDEAVARLKADLIEEALETNAWASRVDNKIKLENSINFLNKNLNKLDSNP